MDVYRNKFKFILFFICLEYWVVFLIMGLGYGGRGLVDLWVMLRFDFIRLYGVGFLFWDRCEVIFS